MVPPAGSLPPCDDRIAGFYRYWQSIRPMPTALPGRQHFAPEAAREFLAGTYLLDVHRDPLRFRVRLIGTELVSFMDHDPTGEWLGEKFRPDFYNEPTYAHYRASAEQRLVCYHKGLPVAHLAGHFVQAERLLLPMARDGRTVDMVLGFAVHHSLLACSVGPAAAIGAASNFRGGSC